MLRFYTFAALTGLFLLGGCSALSPYSTQTRLDLRLVASDELNPDINGRPSPIVVRLMALKHPVAFQNADFFSLYDRARDHLAPDLLASEELELRPGEVRELKLSVSEPARYVGVIAAYRDLPQRQWQYVLAVVSRASTRVALELDNAGIHDVVDPGQADPEQPS